MMVEVTHGPLKGVVGRLVRKGSHARLVLSVDLIGQAGQRRSGRVGRQSLLAMCDVRCAMRDARCAMRGRTRT
jgi:hypothetical protein